MSWLSWLHSFLSPKTAAAQAPQQAEQQRHEAAAETWTLEDDTAKEFLRVSGRAAAALDATEGTGEDNPLDAFLAEPGETLDAAAPPVGDKDDDPLDAYMAEIAPAVRQALAAAKSGNSIKPDENVLQVCISGLPSTTSTLHYWLTLHMVPV